MKSSSEHVRAANATHPNSHQQFTLIFSLAHYTPPFNLRLTSQDILSSEQQCIALNLPNGNSCLVTFKEGALLVETEAELNIALEAKIDTEIISISTKGNLVLAGDSYNVKKVLFIQAKEIETTAPIDCTGIAYFYTDAESTKGAVEFRNKILADDLVVRSKVIMHDEKIDVKHLDLRSKTLKQTANAVLRTQNKEPINLHEKSEHKRLKPSSLSSKIIVDEDYNQDAGATNDIKFCYVAIPDSSNLSGSNNFETAVISYNELELSGKTHIIGSMLRGSDAAIINNKGRLNIEGSVLRNFECKNENFLSLTKTNIQGEGIHQTIDGALNLKQIEKCKIDTLDVAGNINFLEVKMEANNISLTANAINQESRFEKTDITVKEYFNTDDSNHLKLVDSFITAASIDLNGESEIEDCALTAQSKIDIRGKFNPKHSELIAANKILIDTPETVHMLDTIIQAPAYTVKAKTEYDSCEVTCDFYQQNKKATYKKTQVHAANFMDIQRDATLGDDSLLVTEGQFIASAYVDAQKTEFRSKFYEQRLGDLDLYQASLKAAEALDINPGIEMNAKESLISTKHLYSSGNVSLQDSKLTSKHVTVSSKVEANKDSEIQVSGVTYVASGASLKTKKSRFVTGALDILGSVELSESAQACIGELKARIQGLLDMKPATVIQAKDVRSDGTINLDTAQIISENMDLEGGEFTAYNSHVNVQEQVTLKNSAEVDLESSLFTANSLKSSAQLSSKLGTLIVKEGAKLDSTSSTILARSKITTEEMQLDGELGLNESRAESKEVHINRGAQLKGKNAQIVVKDTMHVEGEAKVDGLKLEANYLYVPGVLDGGTKLDIVADKHMDVQGTVTAKSTTVDANHVTVEMGGGITGREKLKITSLTTTLTGGTLEGDNVNVKTGVMANMGGAVLGYNQSIDAVADINTGLSLPTLPDNPADILTADKLKMVGKTLLSNVSRPAATAVNLVEKSYNLASAGARAVDAVKNQTTKNWEDQRLRHYIAPILDAKSVAVSAQSLANEASNAKQQIEVGYERAQDLANGVKEQGIGHLGQQLSSMDKPNFKEAFEAAAEVGIAAVAPSVNRQSLLSADAGVTASYTVSEQNAFSFHSGTTVGHNVRVQTAYDQYNIGTYDANTLNLEAGRHFNYGQEYANDHLIFTANEAHIAKGAELISEKKTTADVSGDFHLDGEVDLTGGKFKVGGETTVDETGRLYLQSLNFETKKLQQEGFAFVSDSNLKTEEYKQAESVLTALQQSQFLAQQAKINGDFAAIESSNIQMQNVLVDGDGNLIIDETSKHAASMLELQGNAQYNLDGIGNLNSLHIADDSQASVRGVLAANTIKNESVFILKREGIVVAENYTAKQNAFSKIADNSIFNTKRAELDGVTKIKNEAKFRAEETEITGQTIINDNASAQLGNLRVAENAELDVMYGGFANADTIKQDGAIKIKQGAIAANNIDQGASAELKVEESVLIAKDANFKNTVDILDGSRVEINNTSTDAKAKVRIESSLYRGDTATHSGNIALAKDATYAVKDTTLKDAAEFNIEKEAKAFALSMRAQDSSRLNVDGVLGKGLNRAQNEKGEWVTNLERMDDLQIGQDSQANVTGTIAAQKFDNSGTADFAGAFVDAGSYIEAEKASTKMRDKTNFNAETSKFAGTSVVSGEESVANLGKTHLVDNAQMNIESKARVNATEMKQDGEVRIDDAALVADKLDQGALAKTDLEKSALLKVKKGELHGKTDVKDNSLLDIAQGHGHAGSEINISDSSLYKGDKLIQEGKLAVQKGGTYKVTETSLQSKGQFSIDAGGAAFTSKLDIKDEAKLNNQGLLAKSLKINKDKDGKDVASLEKIDELNVKDKAKLTLAGSTAVNKLENQAEIAFVGGIADIDSYQESSAATTMVQNKDTKVFMQNSNWEGKSRITNEALLNAGDAALSRNASMQVENKAKLYATSFDAHGALKLDRAQGNLDKLNIAKEGKVTVESSELNSDNTTIKGNLEVNSSLARLKKTTIEKDGNYSLREGVHEGDTLENQGTFKVTGSLMDKEEDGKKFKQYTASVKLDESLHNAVGANTNIDTAYVDAKKLQQDGKLDTKDTTLKSEHVANTGEWNYQGSLNVNTKHIESSLNSSMQGSDNSHFGLIAETSNMQGREDHDATSQEVKNMAANEALDLLNKTGKHENKNVRKAINVATDTKDAVVINKYNRDGVAVGLKTGGDITSAAEYSGKGLSLETTGGSINMKKGATADQSVFLKAAGDINKARVAVVSKHGNAVLDAGGKVDNSRGGLISANEGIASVKGAMVDNNSTNSAKPSKIEGKFTSVEATKGNVENRGGIIGGTTFTEVKAARDVINTALETKEWRGHDHATVYKEGVIAGGSGNDDTKGIGLQVTAGGKVINEASVMGASGKTVISGREGVNISAKSSAYVSYHDKRHHGAANQTKEEVIEESASFGKSTIMGEQVVITSEQGEVRLHGTDTISKGGTMIEAKGKITLESAVQKTTKKEYKEEVWGFFKKKKKSENEHESLTTLTNVRDGQIFVHSKEDNIEGQGVQFMGTKETDLVLKAKKDVNIGARNLQHKVRDHSVSADVTVAGQSIVNPASGGNFGDRLAKADPTAAALKQFMGSENPMEAAVNMYNAAASTANLAKELAKDGPAGALQNRANVTLTVTETDTTMRRETEGGGGIYTFRNVNMSSETGDVNLGVDFADIDKMKVKANTFNIHNNELHSSVETKTHSASVGYGASGWSGGASASENKSQDTTQTQRRGQVGMLELDVNKLKLDGAQVECDDISGRADEIETIDKTNIHKSEYKSASVNSSGGGSIGAGNASGEEVGAFGKLHVKNGINTGPDHHLDVKKHTNYGSEGITTDDPATNKLYEQGVELEQHDLDLHSTRTGGSIGVSGKGDNQLITISSDMQDYRSKMAKDGLHETKHDRFKASITLEDPSKTFAVPQSPADQSLADKDAETNKSKQKIFDPEKEDPMVGSEQQYDDPFDLSSNMSKEKEPVLFSAAPQSMLRDLKNAAEEQKSAALPPSSAPSEKQGVKEGNNNKPKPIIPQKDKSKQMSEENEAPITDLQDEDLNAEDAAKFGGGVGAGYIGGKGLAKLATKVPMLGTAGAALTTAELLDAGREFESNHFYATEEYENLTIALSNGVISREQFDAAIKGAEERNKIAEMEAANRPPLLERVKQTIKEDPFRSGVFTGGLLSAFGLSKNPKVPANTPAVVEAVEEANVLKPIAPGKPVVKGEEPLHYNTPASDRVQHEAYKTVLRQQQNLKNSGPEIIQNEELRNVVNNELYKPNAKIGSGSTADAARVEVNTGELVNGKNHSSGQKNSQIVTKVQDWLINNPDASSGDRAIAENILKDMADGLKGANFTPYKPGVKPPENQLGYPGMKQPEPVLPGQSVPKIKTDKPMFSDEWYSQTVPPPKASEMPKPKPGE